MNVCVEVSGELSHHPKMGWTSFMTGLDTGSYPVCEHYFIWIDRYFNSPVILLRWCFLCPQDNVGLGYIKLSTFSRYTDILNNLCQQTLNLASYEWALTKHTWVFELVTPTAVAVGGLLLLRHQNAVFELALFDWQFQPPRRNPKYKGNA